MFFAPSEIPADAAHTRFAESSPEPKDDKNDWNAYNRWNENDWHNDWHDDSWHNGWSTNWADERNTPRHETTTTTEVPAHTETPHTQAPVEATPVPAPETTSAPVLDEIPIHLEPMPSTVPPSPQTIPVVKEVAVTVSPAPESTDAPIPTVVLLPHNSDLSSVPPAEPNDPYSTMPAPANFAASMMSFSSAASASELSPSQYELDFQALQSMANRGPPTTLDQRYSRQVIANRLGLSPLVYNLMVFGEVPP